MLILSLPLLGQGFKSTSFIALRSVYVGQGSTIRFVGSRISFLDFLLIPGRLFGRMKTVNVADVL